MEVLIAILTIVIQFCLSSPLYRDDIKSLKKRDEFTCDIIITDAEKDELAAMNRAGLVQPDYRWPNNTVIYHMGDDFNYFERELVKISLKIIEDVTCVRFIQRTTEDFFVNVTANNGCSAQVGFQRRFQSGTQRLNLQRSGCFHPGIIIHEFLHTLGFYHMHSLFNRDEFVEIMWENIEPGREHNFNKHESGHATDFEIGYDLLSILHYGAFDFSANGDVTIQPHDPQYKRLMGQRDTLSEKDIARINQMYNCT